MKTKSLLVLGVIIIVHLSVKAQVKIGNNPTSINSNSLLELESSSQGFVLPRVVIGDVSYYSPLTSTLLTGTIVYNTSSTTTGGSGAGIYYWDGTKWVFISTGTAVSSSAWLLTGNTGTNASTNFIGTTDAIDFVARTANTERMRILGAASGNSKAGWIGMGITIPRSSLDVQGHYSNKNVLTLENSSTSGYSSVDMLDSAGNLAATFGYGNLGTGSFAGKAYFNGYGNDFLFTRGSSPDLLMKGTNGYVGINTITPSERLHVVGNIYLNGAFMPGGTAGTSGYVLTSAGAGVSPTWTSPNSLAWALAGNSGTSYATNFLGTTDNVSMRFRTNNVQRMIIDSLGRVGIGIGNPAYALSVLSASNPLYLSGVQATSTFSADSVLTINNGVVKKIASSSVTNNWLLTGNAGTNSAINFLGTTDNHPLKLKVNNTIAGFIDSSGGLGNTYFGSNAGFSNTTGSGNTLIGAAADSANSNGTSNTALGYQAGYSNTSGGSNTFTGYQSGYSNTTASGNLFSGFQAGYKNTTGQSNIFSGYWAGYSNTTGANNTSVGYLAGFGNTTGGNNIFIGSQAGSTNTTGSRNTLIGGNSNVLTNGLANAAAIGYNAKVGLNNSLVLGDTTSGGNAVNVGIGVRYPLKRLHIDAAPTASAGSSDSLKIDNLASSSSSYNKAIMVIDSATGYVSKQSLVNLYNNINWSLTGNSGTNYATNFLGTTDSASLRFRTSNTQRMIIDSLGHVGIGSSSFDPYNPGKLLVDYGATTSNTLANFKGSTDSYFQINLQNKSGTGNASTDYVATADDGTDSTYYIDMGINSSNYAFSIDNWGQAHDAYLYSNSKNLYIGTQASNSDVIFLVGGGRAVTNAALRIRGNTGNVVVGKGDLSSTPVGNILRGPNGYGTNIVGGNLTVQGGSATGTATAGNLLLNGGTSSSGANGIINLSTSGTERMRIDTSGYIGIGTTNPSNALSVFAASNPLYLSGVQATSTFTVDSVLTINAGVVKKAPYSSISNATTNALALSGNTLTSTVNGVAATSNTVSGVSNTSSANTLSTTVNGVTGTSVNIINSNTKTWTQSGGLTTTVNGIASNVTPATGTVNNILGYDALGAPVYQSLNNINLSTAWNLTGNSGTTAGTNFIGTTDAVDFIAKTNSTERMRVLANGRVGIGLTNPSYTLAVKDTMEIRRVGALSELLFTNTSGSGDFRIGGDGGDIFWQGGGGRALQMGSYWTTVIGGDRLTSTYPAFINSLTGTSVLVQGQRDASVPLGVQANSASQTANLTEWRNSSATALSVINKSGYMGIGITTPPNALSVLAASNPLYLSGVQATSTLTTDSLLTINAGVVKKTAYSALAGATTNTLSLSTNTLTSTVNGVAATSNAVSGVSNTSSANTFATTVNGVTGTTVPIINTNTNALTQSGGLVNTVNGVAATTSIPTGTVSNILGYNTSGSPVYQSASGILSGAITNTFVLSGNTLTSTVNGVAASSNAVSSVGNTSSANTLTTTVNGVAGTTVPIINTNTNALTQAGGLVTTVNGVAATTSIANGTVSNLLGYNSSGTAVYQSLSNVNLSTAWNITGNSGTTANTGRIGYTANNNFLGTTDAKNFSIASNNITRAVFDQSGNHYGGGTGTNISSSATGSFAWGDSNLVYGNDAIVGGTINIDSSKNAFVFGNNNVLGAGGAQTNRGTILGGGQNTVTGTAYNSMINGSQNTISGNSFESIFTGYLNNITTTQKSIVSGQGNTVSNVGYGVVSGGFNTLNNASNSNILGGGNSVSANYANAIGGSNTINTGADYSLALGQSNTIAASHTNAFAVGKSVTTTAANQFASNFSGGYNFYTTTGATSATSPVVTINSSGNVGIGLSTSSYALGVLSASNPLYLAGVQATSTFTTDSLLTINGGVVKKTPYSSLPGGSGWSLTGNSISSGNFLGTTNAQALVFKYNSTNAGYLDATNTAFGTSSSVTSTATSNNTAIGYTATAKYSSTAVGYNAQAVGQNNSLAVGYSATAYTQNSVAIGTSSVAGASGSSQNEGVAVGYNATAAGNQAIAIGSSSSASNVNGGAIAIGTSSTAAGYQGIALGSSASASATNGGAIAIGVSSTAQGYQGIAIGSTASASNTNGGAIAMGVGSAAAGYQGIAIGSGAVASNTSGGSVAVGAGSTASGYQSTAIGNGATASANNSTAIGNGAATSTANTLILGNGANVGIGTSTPSEKLDVVGNLKFSGALMPNNTAGTTGYVLTSAGAGTPPVWINPAVTLNAYSWSLYGNGGTTPGTNYIGTSDNVDFVAKTNATERLRITAGGNVGIGTTAPIAPLDFGNSALGNKLFLWQGSTSNSYGFGIQNSLLQMFAATGANIGFGTGASGSFSETMRVTSGGRVGISTTAPNATLEVSGTGTSIQLQASTTAASDRTLAFVTNTAGGGGSLSLRGYGASYSETLFGNAMAGSSAIVGQAGSMVIGNYPASPLIFGTNNTEAMRITSGQNVGIGTTAPNNKLEITQGTSGNSGLRFTNLTSANTPVSNPSTQNGVLGVNATGDVVLVKENANSLATSANNTGSNCSSCGGNTYTLAPATSSINVNVGDVVVVEANLMIYATGGTNSANGSGADFVTVKPSVSGTAGVTWSTGTTTPKSVISYAPTSNRGAYTANAFSGANSYPGVSPTNYVEYGTVTAAGTLSASLQGTLTTDDPWTWNNTVLVIKKN